jgi:hypothetical protein
MTWQRNNAIRINTPESEIKSSLENIKIWNLEENIGVLNLQFTVVLVL